MKDVKNRLHSLGVLEHSNAEIDSFFIECKKRNVSPFLGVARKLKSDVWLYDVEQLFEYCYINGLKSVIIDYDYEEKNQTTINVEVCKNILSNYYNTQKLLECRYKSFNYIKDDYFDTVKNKIISEFEKEVAEIKEREKGSKDNTTGQLISLTAYVIHNGLKLWAFVYQNEAADLVEEDITEESLIKKYKEQIDYYLDKRIHQAIEEEKATDKKTREDILKNISTSIRNNIELLTMNTQKKRTEYVDRIVSEWKYDQGYDWLLKKDITAIVESEYFHAIDEYRKRTEKKL